MEDGTSPHIMNESLMVWDEDGKTIATRRVDHPGNRAYKYMESAYEAQIAGIEDRIGEAIDKWL